MALISVIVPVYNVEPFLRRCLDSILSQTFTDYELILIDDGSTDQSGTICDSYAANNPCIHVIHQENLGLSAARNVGLDYVMKTGSEWITFIDSDDYVVKQYLEALYGAAKDYGIAAAGRKMTTGEDLPEADPSSIKLLSVQDYYLNYAGHTPTTNKLFRKSLFADIRFPVGKIHEDNYITHKILFQFDVIPYVRSPLYAHYKNMNSITFSPWNLKRLDALPATEEQIPYFLERGFLEIAEYCFRKYIGLTRRSQNYIRKLDSLTNKEKHAIIKQLNQKLFQILFRYRKYHWLHLNSKKDLLIILDCLTGGTFYRIWKWIKSSKK